MGVMWFSVTPVYSQKIDKHWLKSDRLDFWNPQFNHVGFQPVFKKELTPLNMNSGNVDSVFGYNRPYSDLVSRQDECHGLFRTELHNFLLQRIFAAAPSLGSQFIYMNSDDLTDIFAVTDDTDKIYGAIAFDSKLKCGIPRFSIPRVVG